MHMTAIRLEDSQPLEGVDDDGIGAIGGLVLGLGMSLVIWLVPLTAWLVLA
jgi:hypothetical protein